MQQEYIAIFGVIRLGHSALDPAIFKIVWEQQENGDWDKVLYARENYLHAKGTTAWARDRYLESNVSNKEYFIRQLNGTLDGT